MIDCFGIDVSIDEIRRWSELTAGPTGFGSEGWALQPYDPSSSRWPAAADHFFEHFFPIPCPDLPQASVMELGCGPGYNAGVLLPFIREFIGVDISVFCVALSKYRFARLDSASFHHTVYDVDLIVEKANTVDVVFGKYFFIHQPQERIRPMLEFSHRMLRPGGRIIIDRQTERFPWHIENDGEWVPGSDWWGFTIDRDWLVGQLREVGFDSIEIAPSGIYVKSVDRDDVIENIIARRA